MIGALSIIGYVLLLGGAGAAIGELLHARVSREDAATADPRSPTESLGWGWSFLMGTATLGVFLYIPLAVSGQISHRAFLAGFAGCVVLCGWHLWRNRKRLQFWRAMRHHWMSDLPSWARWVMSAVFIGAAWSCLSTAPTGFDARAIYALKARLLYDTGTLHGDDFQDVDQMHFNAHYPLLLPLVVAEWFWLQASMNDTQLRVIFLAYIVALASILARQLRRYDTPRVAAWATGLMFCIPVVIQTNEGAGLTSSVDLPLACYVVAGTLSAMNWLRKRTPQQAILAGLMYGAAALTKSEGMLWIAAASGSLLIVLAARQSQLNRATIRNGLAGACLLGFILALQMAVRHQIPYSPYLRSYSAALSWDWLHQLRSRPWAVVTYGLADCLRLVVWNMTWPCILAIMFLRRKRAATTEIWFARLLIGIVAIVFFAIFVITPYHVYWQIATALHRLVLQLLPLAWLLAIEQLSASGWIEELRRAWNAITIGSKSEPDRLSQQIPEPFSPHPPKSRWPLRRAG